MRFRKPGETQQDLLAQMEHARDLAQRSTPLDKLSATIDFEMFREILLERLGYKDRIDKGGNAPFDPVFMFKIIVLQKYYALSEEQTEFQILDRFSFMRFLKVAPGDDLPDKNTIWDFKEKLGTEGVVELFEQFSQQLGEAGVYGKEGVIVDASFVDVPRQRNTREENASIKKGETPKDWKEQPNKLRQKDLDARWTKKNNELHYGYKNHVKCDAATKLIKTCRVSEASQHDSQTFEELLEIDDLKVYGDSAYRSKASMSMLRRKKLKARLCQKGTKNKALTPSQKRENRKKSQVRCRVEHIFGIQSWQMGADWISTIGIVRAARQITLGNLVYNLVRMSQLGLKAA